MIAPKPRCSRDNLQQLLGGQLNDAVAADVTVHIETCPTCRQDLENLAAEGSWWQDARRFLSAEESSPEDAADRTTANTLQNSTDLCGGAARDLVAGYLEPTDDPESLGRLDDYTILDVIGCGGMGIVMKGFDRQLNREVAIKVLAPNFATSGAARRRFAREAQAAAAVVHPHVLAIHSVCANSKLPYLVMPFVSGQSLQQRLDQFGPMDLKDVLRIAMQAAEGLAAAHNQGLIHRDVKPANILLENNVERVLLTDFGLARAVDDASLTRSGVIAGTPLYMSPEQTRGDPIDHRTDLFSLGSVMYAMCAGHPPFRSATTMGVLRRICDVAPRPLQETNPDVPIWLAHIVQCLLAKNPENRFACAEEVAELLAKCLAHVQHPAAVPLPDTLQSSHRHSRWKWWKILAAAGVPISVTVALAVFFGGPWRMPPQHDDIQHRENRSSENAKLAVDPTPENSQLPEENWSLTTQWYDGIDQELNDIGTSLQRLDETTDFEESRL